MNVVIYSGIKGRIKNGNDFMFNDNSTVFSLKGRQHNTSDISTTDNL